LHDLAKRHVRVLPVDIVQRWVGARLGLTGDVSIDSHVQGIIRTEVSPDVFGGEAEVGCLFAVGQEDPDQTIFKVYEYGACEWEEGGDGEDKEKGRWCA